MEPLGVASMANNARARKDARIQSHGWFVTEQRDGDRTLEQQLRGLEYVFDESSGKRILDVGCAEGLISMEFATRGEALQVDAFEIVEGHVTLGNYLLAERGIGNVLLKRDDANTFTPVRSYDIVLMLAVLHKLKEPAATCERIVKHCKDLCVIRMGPDGKDVIVDARSRDVPQYIGAIMAEQGFVVERKELGPFDEVTWYYRRKK